jgi:hypothetical protein
MRYNFANYKSIHTCRTVYHTTKLVSFPLGEWSKKERNENISYFKGTMSLDE